MDLQNKIIQITEISSDEKRVKVKDQENKLYSIWRTKSDGNPTQAIGQIQNYVMNYAGKSFQISFSEKPNPNRAGTYFRNIVGIKETNPNGSGLPAGKNAPIISNDLNTRLSRLETDVAFIKGKLGVETPAKPAEPVEEMSADELIKNLPF